MLLDAATSGKHEEPLTELMVRLEADPENPDVFHLVLLRADGSGLEAMGTKNAVFGHAGGGLRLLASYVRPRTFTFSPTESLYHQSDRLAKLNQLGTI